MSIIIAIVMFFSFGCSSDNIPGLEDGTSYYQSLGGPIWSMRGVGELKEKEAKKQHHFKIIVRKGKIKKIIEMRAKEKLTGTYTYSYDKKGVLNEIVHTNAYGHNPVTTKFDEDLLRRITVSGKADMQGCYYHRFSWQNRKKDPVNRRAKFECLNKDKKQAFDQDGRAAFLEIFNESFLLAEKVMLNDSGEEVISYSNYSKQTYKYNKNNRAYKMLHKNIAGKLAAPVGTRCVGYEYSYDDAGNQVTQSCLSKTGAPQPDDNGATIQRYIYDKNNCIYQVRYEDKNGELVSHRDGIGSYETERDEHCSITMMYYTDKLGSSIPLPNEKKAYFEHRILNEKGLVVKKHWSNDSQ
jgi:hypothetical protein